MELLVIIVVTMTQSSPGEEGTGCGACGLQGHCAARPLDFHRSPRAAVIGLCLLYFCLTGQSFPVRQEYPD